MKLIISIFVTDYQKDTGYKKDTVMRDSKSTECRGAQRAMRDTLDVVGGKWKLVILSTLIDGKRRFKELAREIGITPRILSKELQELELNRLVTRTVCDTRPITVEYAITAHGQSLESVITSMRTWGYTHRAVIVGAKEAVPSEAVALAVA